VLKPEILFISRNYPPQIGGLETYSYNLIKYVGHRHAVSKIVLGKPRKHLFWFMPYALYKAVCLIKEENVRRIHLCDGFLAPLGLLLKFFLPVTVSVTIHGLDMTFRNFFYQAVIPGCVSRLDKIICVSRHTQKECVDRGVPDDKTWVIPNGIDPADCQVSESRQASRGELAKNLGIPLEGKTILLTVGRLVPRKGVAWFVQEVMPHLDSSYLYLVVGEGPNFKRVSSLVVQYDLKGRVFLLGRVSEETRNNLLHASDLFIMPNIEVNGDIEGFGIAALEAGCFGLPVIASNVQGLKDAVLHERTGFLVEAGNTEAFLDGIEKTDLDRDSVRSLVIETYDWQRVSQRYEEVLGPFPLKLSGSKSR
jgi:glycosyltransferase involved in cell wall biosynthesis